MTSTILFDGVCNLCNGFVRFVITRDPARRFQFAPLQSKAAAQLMPGRPGQADTIVLVEAGRVFVRSTAVLRIARRLRFPWPLAYWLVAIPRPIRDFVYGGVARRRYGWFGKQDACMVPTADIVARFVGEPSVDIPKARPLR